MNESEYVRLVRSEAALLALVKVFRETLEIIAATRLAHFRQKEYMRAARVMREQARGALAKAQP